MKKLLTVAVIAALSSFSSVADESKQLFNHLNFGHPDEGDNLYYVSSHYFFEPQQHSGVWDDFGYLNTDTNISLAYQRTDYARDLSVAGEWFANDEWFVTGSVGDIGHISYKNSVGFGYLFDNKIKISARYDNLRHSSNRTMVKAEYNHQINDTDYLGVTLDVESDLDNWALASRYFKHVSGDSFVSLDIYHEDDEGYDYTSVVGNYYINRNLSVGLGSFDSDLGIQAKYFFNDKFHLGGSIIDFDGGEVYQLSFTAQY